MIWEPRYGDVSASGELGYLTGPVRNIRASRDGGQTPALQLRFHLEAAARRLVHGRHGRRHQHAERGPFAAGFTRAPQKNRFTGDYDDSTPPLGTADEVLNSALKTSPLRAYRAHLAEGVRFHRQNQMPVVGQQAATKWLASQRPSSADSRFSEAARSGDLGYTWGTYTIAPTRTVTADGRGAAQPLNVEAGFYVRIWVRERNGQWKVALDVLQ